MDSITALPLRGLSPPSSLPNSAASDSTSGTAGSDVEMQALPPQTCRPVIERYANGYPQFSALISSADCFLVARRFKRVRARILLMKQCRIGALEKQLDDVDDNEKCPAWRGTMEHDKNARRQGILDELDERLADYDRFVEATKKLLSYEEAKPRDIQSLQNWLDTDGWVIHEDRAYLSSSDLFYVAPPADNAMAGFESWVEFKLKRVLRYRQHHRNNISTNEHVHIYSGQLIKRLAMGLMISLITLLLLLPIVICNVVTTTALRIFIVLVSTIFYLLVLSSLTSAKITELVVAATTYATVLIVFVSGANQDTDPRGG